MKTKKSVVLSAILSMVLGPIGMFYSTITGALIMIFVTPIIFTALALYLGSKAPELFLLFVVLELFLYYIICIFWSITATVKHNNRMTC